MKSCEKRHLAVIGGTAAGLSAASRARKLAPDMTIAVYERTGYVSYGSCGLPYYIGDVIHDHRELIAYMPEFLKKERNIDVKTHHEVVDIDLSKNVLMVRDLEKDALIETGFTDLIMATGASPVIPPLPGIDLENVFALRIVEDGIRIKNRIDGGEIKRAAIIGGGYIGLEMAEALKMRGLEVLLFEAMPKLLPSLDESFSDAVEKELTKNGVSVHKATAVKEIVGNREGKVCGIKTDNGQVFYADMVLVSVGVAPNSRLAKKAGIEVGYKEGIVVDDHMRTSAPGVWACGDCVQMYNLLTKKPTYIPLGTTANKQGKIAGENAAGGNATFKGVLGTQVIKVFDVFIASTGLTVESAAESGMEAICSRIVKNDRASYYPGNKNTHIHLILEKGTGKILGAQLMGGESVAQRINVFVAAIAAGFTVYRLNELDLAYAPPVAPVYDPILIAASEGIKALKNN
ncbi:MAG: FAD-dependent oxidoreductase [Tepidanaerobacteraceae bacterium]|nr:FAD-dependent oxidoreductase [Tepidanaerobacteraceae bacterium]